MHPPRSLAVRDGLSAPDWRSASTAATPATEKKYDPFPSYHGERRPHRSFSALTPNMIDYRATYPLLNVVHSLSIMEQPFKDVVVGPAPDPAKFDADFKTTFRDAVRAGGDVYDEAWYIAGYSFAKEFRELLAAHPLFKDFVQHSKSNSLQAKLQCRKGKGPYLLYGIEDNPKEPSDCWAVCALKLELLGGGRVRVHRFDQVGAWMSGAARCSPAVRKVRNDDLRGRDAYKAHKEGKTRRAVPYSTYERVSSKSSTGNPDLDAVMKLANVVRDKDTCQYHKADTLGKPIGF